jgi:hypothetical protein
MDLYLALERRASGTAACSSRPRSQSKSACRDNSELIPALPPTTSTDAPRGHVPLQVVLKGVLLRFKEDSRRLAILRNGRLCVARESSLHRANRYYFPQPFSGVQHGSAHPLTHMTRCSLVIYAGAGRLPCRASL